MEESSKVEVPSKILDHLYLGCVECAENIVELQKLNIKTIIQVGIKAKNCEDTYGLHEDKNPLFECFYIEIIDSPFQNITQYFETCNELICKTRNEKQGATLVHCRMGRSRSVTIVLAYLMKHEAMSLKDAYDFVLERRPQAFSKFIEQLHKYEYSIFGKNSVELLNAPSTTEEVEAMKRLEEANMEVEQFEKRRKELQNTTHSQCSTSISEDHMLKRFIHKCTLS